MIFGNELLSDITCMIELAEQRGNTVVDTDGSSLDTSSAHTNNTIESSNDGNDELRRSQSLDQLRSNTNNNVEQQQSKQDEQDRRWMTRQHRRGQRRKSTNCLSLLFKNNYNISSNENNDDNNNILLRRPLLLRNRSHSTELC